MIVAGEPSGDAHAAALVSALHERAPDVSFFGATGPLMRASGVDTIVNSDSLAIMEIVEVGQVFHWIMRVHGGMEKGSKHGFLGFCWIRTGWR